MHHASVCVHISRISVALPLLCSQSCLPGGWVWGVEAPTEEQPRLQGQVVSTYDREPKLQGTMCVCGSAVTPSSMG